MTKTRTVFKPKLQLSFSCRMKASEQIVLNFDKGNKGTNTQLILSDDEAIRLRDYLIVEYGRAKTLCEVFQEKGR